MSHCPIYHFTGLTFLIMEMWRRGGRTFWKETRKKVGKEFTITSNCQSCIYWLLRRWWCRQLLLVSWSTIKIVQAHLKLISGCTQSLLLFEIQKCLTIIFSNLIPIFISFFHQIIYINLQLGEFNVCWLFNKSNSWVSRVLFSP